MDVPDELKVNTQLIYAVCLIPPGDWRTLRAGHGPEDCLSKEEVGVCHGACVVVRKIAWCFPMDHLVPWVTSVLPLDGVLGGQSST
jgi:hypothetical protein